MTMDRRSFLARSAVALGASVASAHLAWANPLGLPLAIQLYSVRQQMTEDLDMALAAIAAAGFQEVESAALPAKPAKEIRAALDKAGLKCVSSHHGYADLHDKVEERCAYDAELGSKAIVCSSPGHRDASVKGNQFSLDDWRFNADNFNDWSAMAARHGLKFGYHNHIHEFDLVDGTSPYEELLKRCDATHVFFELDCGWALVAGHDPVELMKAHPHRFTMLHVKDFHLKGKDRNGEPAVTELGRGDVDYKPVLAQARLNQHIQHAFVEQEAFDVPWQESLTIDAEYMRALS